jgi:N-acetylmuramoyl-L-alanine amidase
MTVRFVLGVCLVLVGSASGIEAQAAPRLGLEREDGSTLSFTVGLDRGYAVVPLSVLDELGWSVAEEDGSIVLSAADEITVSMRTMSPYFRWDGVVLQMTDPPYRAGGRTYVPVQFLTDFLPRRLPGLYEFDGERSVLRAGDVSLLPGGGLMLLSDRTVEEEAIAPVFPVHDVRVVIIDPGHGGADPGALGPDGIREKDVALQIGLRLAEELRGQPDLEVHLIRDDDSFVDVWERGQIATDLKGERPGVFVSIHANSFPARSAARGFETYFLSDARTEHERRVSAIENAPITMSPDFADSDQLADLDFILRDLRNYEHAHWSADLAGLIQDELEDFHPGPDRGVKQGVLAVLTNALMPSVLVEVGYLSNPNEGRVLAETSFHEASAEAIGDAVLTFFERYPPGTATGGAREDR